MKLKPGSLCIVEFPIAVTGIDQCGETICFTLQPGELFTLLDAIEINILGVIEVQILFENKKLWFNIHRTDCNIEHVRRAESYDIPFMTLQEAEPGSKLAL